MLNWKDIQIWKQSFREIRENNQLYIDKTKDLLEIVNSWNYYYSLTKPKWFWKTLTIDIMKEMFLWNKELFKGLYAYKNYKGWNKSYPVLILDFIDFKFEDKDDILSFIEKKTKIYIWDNIYRVNDFFPWWIKNITCFNIQNLIEVIYKKNMKKSCYISW